MCPFRHSHSPADQAFWPLSMMERLGGWSSLELKRLCHAGRFSLGECRSPAKATFIFSPKAVP